MGKLKSYRDLGSKSSSSKANWLEAWKDNGILICVPHKDPPSTRTMHNCRRIETTETKDGPMMKIRWYPFVCWETDEYYKGRRFNKDNPPRAQFCPTCRFIEHIESRDDFPNDQVILTYKVGRELLEVMKVDLVGKGTSKTSYLGDMTGRTEFVFSIIPYEDPSKGVCLTNEKWSLGQEFVARINNDIKMYGEDEGNPERTPIVYTFEYNKQTRKYSVSRYQKPEISDEIQALWNGPSPDVDRYTRPSNPETLFDSIDGALQIDGVPLEEIFAPSIEQWRANKPSDDTTDFDPDKIEAEIEEEKEAKQKRATQMTNKVEAPKETRPTRHAKKPEPKKDVKVFECESCGGDWPEDEATCPHCGATAEVAVEVPKKTETRASRF